jgi:glycosyltransferase involved in cell wall biosynthesis
LSPEKGAGVLVEAWSKIPDRPLIIVGDGPELPALRAVAPPSVTFAGRLQRDEVYDLVGSASMLVVPSLWYEGFPMVVVEALALGTPVVASRLGSLAEIVDDDRTGIHFNPGDADDLTAKVSALAGDTDRLARMSGNARATFLDRYTDARNLEMLEAIYGDAVALARSQRGSRR